MAKMAYITHITEFLKNSKLKIEEKEGFQQNYQNTLWIDL